MAAAAALRSRRFKWSLDLGAAPGGRPRGAAEGRGPLGFADRQLGEGGVHESDKILMEKVGGSGGEGLPMARTPLATLKALESSSRRALQGLVFLVGNGLGLALALYKCQAMGLLPTRPSDWLAFVTPPQRMEFTGGGLIL
ncbi:ER membrane protein complex subunit 4 [Malurus melanocephalus]|uniref:ER membrane protein complex subunit 4 n=1 Tax=Malurus melanocephalus TaxID=175006 RepID=UPI002547E7A7|nr:ER membrane protein complex subunit 4 [Malurus melanocephalus]